MAKKKTKQKRHAFRNASAPRPRGANLDDDGALKRLAYTIGGAGGAALAVSVMKHEGWKPKTIATALGAGGAALAWKASEPSMRSIGAGVMSAAGAQLALLMIEDHDAAASATSDTKPADSTSATASSAPRQADALPPGALENALARAQARLAISDAELVA